MDGIGFFSLDGIRIFFPRCLHPQPLPSFRQQPDLLYLKCSFPEFKKAISQEKKNGEGFLTTHTTFNHQKWNIGHRETEVSGSRIPAAHITV